MTRPVAKILILTILFALTGMKSVAQEPMTATEEPQSTIVDHINDSTRNAVILDEDIYQLLIPGKFEPTEKKAASGKRTVYRVQVFSDNRAERSKQEARNRERNIKRRFPDQPTYVVYSTPYWRLQIGSFASQEEASQLAAKIQKAFPAYARETHVVRARVSVAK